MRIRRIKKIIISLIIITMLQTQIVSLSNIAWAINAEMTGETAEGFVGGNVSGTVEIDTEEPLDSTEEPSEDVSEGITGEVVEDNSTVLPEEGEDVVEESEEPTEEPTEGVEPEEETPPTEEPTEEVEPVEPTPPTEEEESEVQEEVVEPKVELNIKSENSSIYKGYLYANATSNLRYETNYNTIEEVVIQGSKNGIEKVAVTENEDKIKMITATKMALLNGIYYKKARVSVDEFKNILGENGTINIYDASKDFVGYIDANSPEVNGYYEYTFKYYTNSVTYELSSPIADGTIRIINDKAIKEDSLYSREQIATFSTINITADVEMVVGDIVLTASNEGDITLQETEAKIEMELDKTELSTEDENELTLTLTLKTDAERYELFKNPVIEVEMPSNINELSIEGVNLLYKNGLSLKNWEVAVNDRGNKVLRIEMEGAQSVYTPGIVQQGTTLVLYLKAKVNKLTANTSETMKLTYTNEDSVRQAYLLEGKSAEEVLITFVAKHGMLKGVTAVNNETTTIGKSYEEEIDKIEVKSNVGTQKVTITGTIVNNFEKEVKDVVVVGRIPFVGNKKGNGEDLLSDFNTMFASEVLTTGNMTEVYYSEDGAATKDDDTWTQDVTDMSMYKSYKVVVKEGTLKKGERVDFTYEIILPENLGYNLKSYSTYTVMYTLDNQELSGDCMIALVTEEKELEAEDMPTQEEVEKFTIGTQVSQGGKVLTEEDSVYERQILRYTVVITNTSNEVLTNVKLTGRAENANLYTWIYTEHPGYNGQELYIAREYGEDVDGTIGQDEMLIERLEPGESRTFEYQVITKKLEDIMDVVEIKENEVNVCGIITVSADNIEEKTIETEKHLIVNGELELRVAWAGTESVTEKDTFANAGFSFYTYVKNITDRDFQNVELKILIPNELEFENNSMNLEGVEGCDIKFESVTEGEILIITIPKLNMQTSRTIYIRTHAKEMDYTIGNNSIDIIATGKVDDTIYYSNDYSKMVFQNETKLEHSWTGNASNEILENGQVITFDLVLKNIGMINTGYITLRSKVPNGLFVNDVILVKDNIEENLEILDNMNEIVLLNNKNIELESNEEILIRINTTINSDYFLRDQETIDFKIEVEGKHVEKFETEVISYKIHNENVTIQDIVNPDIGNNDDVSKEENSKNDEEVIEQPEEKPNTGELQKPENQIKPEVEKEEIIRTYMISGKVWLDINKDGINRNESGVQSVVVMLFKTTDKGNITTIVKQTVTNSNGEYTFTAVEEGNYVVVFSYDTGLYNSTKYHVSTATTSENSDAITKAVNIGGSSDIYGITDMITIKGAGAINVDLGLVNKNEFDLSLDKYITSATVTNKNGTKTYKYEQEKSVKLEIHSKYFKDSQIDITYKILVKNTGEVDGYVNKIVDYVPEDMKFDNNKNAEWYYGDDGNLYYKGLIGKAIKPGETKEITLVLTKVLDKGEAGKVVNGAEIAESTNSLGLIDIDSTPGNKEKREDDYGEVSLMITISTGSEVKNISLIILTLLIIMIVVYIAKFKTTKKVYR